MSLSGVQCCVGSFVRSHFWLNDSSWCQKNVTIPSFFVVVRTDRCFVGTMPVGSARSIGVVGVGNVGMAGAYASLVARICSEIVLVDLNKV